MNTPRLARFIQRLGEIQAHGACDRVPADADTSPLFYFHCAPFVECVTGVEKGGYGPFFPDAQFYFRAAGDDVVRPDIVIAQAFETVAPETLASAGFETVSNRKFCK